MRSFPFFSRSQRSAPAPRRGLRLISLLMLLGLLSGCMVRLAYPQVDTWLRWQLDDAFALDSAQNRWLKPRLAKLLKWHRHQELPRYVEALKGLKGAIEQGRVDAIYAEGLREQMNGFLQAIADQAAPDLAALATQLSDANVQHFLATLEKDDAELRKEMENPLSEKDREEIAEAWEERLEDWVGNLNAAQKQRLRVFADAVQDSRALRLDSRARWREGLLVFLQNAKNAGQNPDAALTAEARNLFDNARWRSAEHMESERQRQQAQNQLYADLFASLSDKQRKHLLAEVDDWIDVFASLVR